MRVLVNSLTVEGPRTGIGHYTSELLRALCHLHPDEVDTFPGGLLRQARKAWAGSNLGKPVSAPTVAQRVRGAAVGVARRCGHALIRLSFRAATRRGACDVYHEPNYVPLPCDSPTIASVHDLSALLHPEWHPADRIAHFTKHFHAGLKRCAHLFAISEFGKNEIVKHLGWPADKITVTYMGVRHGLSRVSGDVLDVTLGVMGLKPGYLLHVGTLEPRKNVLMLMKAYCALPASVREKCPLVLAGGRGWNSDDAHEYLQREGRHKNVRWLGYVPDGRFAALYSGARALLFPTFYEGFGMPTIEMMACGGAVVASNAGAVAETAGPRACLLDPHDADAWHHAMQRAATDDDWVAKAARGGEDVAAAFTWERCAEASWGAYLRVSGRPARRAA